MRGGKGKDFTKRISSTGRTQKGIIFSPDSDIIVIKKRYKYLWYLLSASV